MVVLLITAAFAQEPAPDVVPGVSLAWALPAGLTLAVTQETTTDVQTPLGAQSTHLVVTSAHAVTAGGTLGADAVAWTERVVRQQVDIDMAGEKLSWDSGDTGEGGKPKDPPGGFEALPLLLNGTWAVQVAADLAVTVTSQHGEAGAKAKGAGLSQEEVARFLGDDTVASALVGQLGSLPRGAIAVGESRAYTLQIDVPGIGPLAAKHTVLLDRVEGGRAVFHETLSAETAKGESLEVRGLTGKGELTWDVAGSRPLSRTMEVGFDVVVPAEDGPIVLPTRVRTDARVEVL